LALSPKPNIIMLSAKTNTVYFFTKSPFHIGTEWPEELYFVSRLHVVLSI